MLVSFKGDEEKLIDSVISVLDAGREKFTFQEMNIISELQHKGMWRLQEQTRPILCLF